MGLQKEILRKKLEATPGFEPGVKALQASALPLGHVALDKNKVAIYHLKKPTECNIQSA